MPMPAMSASPGAAGSFPALALVLALFMLGYILWATDRLTSMTRADAGTTARSTPSDHARILVTSGAAGVGSQDAPDPLGTPGAAAPRQDHLAGRPILAPRLAESYKIAMGIAMGYMLIMML
jgi:hypothetical protein